MLAIVIGTSNSLFNTNLISLSVDPVVFKIFLKFLVEKPFSANVFNELTLIVLEKILYVIFISSAAFVSEKQEINSVESAQTVVTEMPEKTESLLPDKPPNEQYDFAVSFMKIGDYETAEFALREFIDKNKDHDLAGSAQYWYGETFRIRQLYSDAATAYLDGYQNYPKSKKAPDNLLKLGITMVQLGEKDQGCKMISGIKKEYPKANKSVLQKAQYEQKKFKCKS